MFLYFSPKFNKKLTKLPDRVVVGGCRILEKAGSPGLQVDPSKIVWTPFNAEREYASIRN
jgi:hypothetical protein